VRTSRVKAILRSLVVPRTLVRFNGPSRARHVALTFDDGPIDALTNRTLDALDGTGHRATFFVLGQRAQQSPEIMKRIAALGCEVGNHSYSHARLSRLNQKEIAGEFRRTEAVIRATLGRAPRFVRPPFGELSRRFMYYLARHRITAVGWSAHFGGDEMFEDWSVDQILQHFDADRIAPGDIILLHDTNANVVSALPALLDRLEARQLRSVTLSELFEVGD
jgi:peptidoglycan/xylan/chitin deacetylase (PgdA/CDA1 family)